MSCDCSTQQPICPCGQFVHPAVISNLPGLDQIQYRVGDYTTFRHALLRALPGETCLTANVNGTVTQLWRPGAQGDLAVQMMEWWAYLADILTFYNERGANESFLRTADESINVNRLVQLLGYRPRPGLGATGTLAALLTGSTTVNLPQGFQIQSKPGPGQSPQIFELDDATSATAPDAVPVDPPPVNGVTINSTSLVVRLKGVVSGIKNGDQLLLMATGWTGATAGYALGMVTSLTPAKGPRGNPYTEISLKRIADDGKFSTATTTKAAAGFRLLKSAQSTRLYQYSGPRYWINGFSSTHSSFSSASLKGRTIVDLQSIVRQINSGDPVLFQNPTPSASSLPQLVSVTGVTELIYYANNPKDPSKPPTSSAAAPVAGVAIPHTQIQFKPGLISAWDVATVQVLYAWQDVGQLIDLPASGVTYPQPDGTPDTDTWTVDATAGTAELDVTAATGASLPQLTETVDALVEDASGIGVEASVAPGSNPVQQAPLTVTSPDQPPPSLTSPLRLLFNLLSVSRGQTVSGEVLGTGNGAVGGQDFTLQKSPVTYFQAPATAAVSGDLFSSTVQVRVNGIEWLEVPTFYGQSPTAQVFITREDEQGQTHVVFGDGLNGARIPTGASVTATYRYGSGSEAPAAGSLTNILKPLPGLKAIRNPVAAGGGADPDAPDKVRQLAPASVLTFGRAISVDDYEAIAAGASGVTRVKAEVAFDAAAQRPRVTIWVGDTPAAAEKAQTALAGAADPNRIPAVKQATRIGVSVTAQLTIDATADFPTVRAAATAALVNPDTGLGLFGTQRIGINEPVYDSEIYAACTVPGVLAVKDLTFSLADTSGGAGTRLSPAIRETLRIKSFFHPKMQPQCTDHRHDPGEGCYFFLDPNDIHLLQDDSGS